MHCSTPSGVTILIIHPFRGTHDTRCISDNNGSLQYCLLQVSLETGPPPSGQLNAGVRKEEGLARRPCRARTQECGHLQFEAMRVHTPTVNSGLTQRCGDYGELHRDLQLLREKLHISFDVVHVSRLQAQRITLEPNTKTYFLLTNLQIASLCSALRVSGNPRTSRDLTRVESMSAVVPAIFYTHAHTHVHVVALLLSLFIPNTSR